MPTTTSRTARDLGKVVSHHPIGSLGPVYLTLAICLNALAVWLAFFVADDAMARTDASLHFFIRLIAGIFGFLSFTIVARWCWFRGSDITVLEQGVSYTARKKTWNYPWAEVRAVQHRSYTMVPGNRQGRAWVTIRFADKKRVRITNNYLDVATLGLNLLRLMASHHLPSVLQSIADGNTVDFDAVKVNKQGMATTFRRLPWADCTGAELKDGVVLIRKKNSVLAWHNPFAFQITNFIVFLEVVRRYAVAED